MSMDGSNYSLSDLAAVAGNEGGFGGGMWLLIILFFLIGMGGGGLGRGINDYASAASQQEILFGQRFSNLDNKMDRLGNGIADATFAISNSINNAQTVLGGAITGEGRAIQSQLADCCCTNQRNVDAVRYDMANFTAQINSNIDSKFAAMEKNQLQQTIQAQQSQINALNLAQQMAGVVKYPMTSAWAMNGNPFCNYGCGNAI